MNARRHSTSDFRSLIANTSRGQRLLFAALVSIAILCFAAAEFAFAQGPPDQVVSEHALGNSPFAEQLGREGPVTVTGILTVLHSDDFANKRSENFFYLKDSKTKETYKLRFNKKAPAHLRSGATVKARGRAKGHELYLALDESGGESIETVLPAQVVVSGEQKTLVMAVNFLDKSGSCSVDSIQDLMFTDPADNSIDDLYTETSFGEVWFSGDVVGPYTINYNSDTCDFSQWANAADAEAQAEGIDPSAYSRRVYVMPPNACPAAGIANLGGSSTRAWIFTCDISDVYGHELGHNLGMHHAATPTGEYGDNTDIMGIGQNRLRQINAPHKEQMGWLPPEQIAAVTGSGVYDIAPLELDPFEAPAPQALKIYKPDTNEYYYLSYRRAIGFDANLISSLYLDRLSVHRYPGDFSASKTYFLATLTDGESFVDAVNNITITQISHSDAYVSVQVQMDATCVKSTPIADLSPASQNAAPGSTLTYTVTVSNSDNGNCGQNTYSLDAMLPAGWTGTVSPDSMDLPAGQSDTATLSISSPATATDASYGFKVKVTDAADNARSVSAGASYVVETACSPGKPIAGISPASRSAVAGTTLNYTITVHNTDSASCPSRSFSLSAALPAGWTGSISPATLTLPPGQSETAILSVTSPAGAAQASYGFTVNVSGASPTGASYVVEGINNADTEAPTAPSGLYARTKGKHVNLSWNAATDNVGVSGYAVWRDGVRIGDTADTGYVDSSVSSGMTCTYTVNAYDAAGNISGPSSSFILDIAAKLNQGKGKGKPK